MKGEDNTCMDAWKLVHDVDKQLIPRILRQRSSSPTCMKNMAVAARAYGKETSRPEPKQVILILPQWGPAIDMGRDPQPVHRCLD